MNRLHRAIERRTGLLFGAYRPLDCKLHGRTWLVIAPRQEGQMFSVVIGRRGFCIGRFPKETS